MTKKPRKAQRAVRWPSNLRRIVRKEMAWGADHAADAAEQDNHEQAAFGRGYDSACFQILAWMDNHPPIHPKKGPVKK